MEMKILELAERNLSFFFSQILRDIFRLLALLSDVLFSEFHITILGKKNEFLRLNEI